MQLLILITVALYMAGMLTIGFVMRRRVKNLADYLIAGRGVPFYLNFTALLAAWFGAASLFGISGAVYKNGLLAVTADPWAAGLALIIGGMFYTGVMRKMQLMTVTDLFGRVYSKGSEIFASLAMIPVFVVWLAAQLVAMGHVLHKLLGFPVVVGMILGGVIVLLYTYEGGMWADTISHFIQMTVLLIGLAYLFPVVMQQAGGVSAVLKQTPPEFFRVYPHSRDWGDWCTYVGQWLMMGLGTIVGQDLLQRTLASKSVASAKYSSIAAGLAYWVVGAVVIMLGLAGRILLPGLENPENLVTELLYRYLPPLGIALFVGAILSAFMSAADSALLAASSLASNNILKNIYPHMGEQKLLKLARLITVGMTGVAVLLALGIGQIYNLMVNAWAFLFVAIFVPVTMALYWRKASREACWVSMIGGLGIWFLTLALLTRGFSIFADGFFYQAALAGGSASLLGYLLTTWLLKKHIKKFINQFHKIYKE